MSWLDRKRQERGRRALERQLEYQEHKAAALGEHEDETVRLNFLRSQQVRKKLETIRPITDGEKILEVGSGAHGLVFGLGSRSAIGVDPLAVQYKQLFPKIQSAARSVAAIGEELPFEDAAFDVVLSDNVIDHAERPVAILDELVRVLRPGGLLYFTVNIHHPFYGFVSSLHGAWNALGLKFEISPFADHTVHFDDAWIRSEFIKRPLRIIEQASTIQETKVAIRAMPLTNADAALKKVFFKNALFELLAERTDS